MYFYAIITGVFESDLNEFVSEFQKQPAVKKFFSDEKEAYREFNERLKEYPYTMRLREYEEEEMTLASQVLECHEYEKYDRRFRTQIIKFKTWDN
jgi:hypothetical protein